MMGPSTSSSYDGSKEWRKRLVETQAKMSQSTRARFVTTPSVCGGDWLAAIMQNIVWETKCRMRSDVLGAVNDQK